jgi:hypothetical protein
MSALVIASPARVTSAWPGPLSFRVTLSPFASVKDTGCLASTVRVFTGVTTAMVASGVAAIASWLPTKSVATLKKV